MPYIEHHCRLAITALCVVLTACATPTAARSEGGGGGAAVAAPSAAEAVVEAQLAAYNRRDLEGFLSYYADDAVLLNHPDQVTQSGKEQLRARYRRGFGNPNVRAVIIKRLVFDRFVVDHERITAPPAKGELEAVAVYEVKDGKIVRVTFLNR